MNNSLFTINSFSFQHYLSHSVLLFNGNAYIPEKGCTLICGASGVGKTTLINILCGVIPKYYPGKFEGSIFYNKTNILDKYPETLNSHIGYIFQNPYAQIVTPYVANEIVFSLENKKIEHDKGMKQYAEVVEYFDIADILDRSTQFLSGGESQKVNLASILVVKPKILVFDEPTSFLDPQQRDYLYTQIAKLKKNHTIILIDHILDKALEQSDTIIYINKDRSISMETKKSIEMKLYDKNYAVSSKDDMKSTFLQKSDYIKGIENSDSMYKKKSLENKDSLQDYNYCFCDSISFFYGKKNLFNNLSLKVNAGEIISIVGKNGSGKTTFLKLLSGLIKPSSGKINYQINNTIQSVKAFRDFGCIQFQNSESMFFFKTVFEELSNEIKKQKVTMNEVMKKYKSFFPMEKYRNKSPFELSEGEKRRLCFLICLIKGKNVMLYDEPTFGQDNETIAIMEQTMFEMKISSKLQILVTHDIDFAMRISDKIFILGKNGLFISTYKIL